MKPRDPLAKFNERVKLAATSVNAVGLAFVGLGFVRPLIDAEVAFGPPEMGFATIGLACHASAHYILRYLRKDA